MNELLAFLRDAIPTLIGGVATWWTVRSFVDGGVPVQMLSLARGRRRVRSIHMLLCVMVYGSCAVLLLHMLWSDERTVGWGS